MTERSPFILLARAVSTLAASKPITAPFVMGARQREFSETFIVGNDRVNGGDAVLHKVRTRKGDVVNDQLADPCFWSLDELRSYLLELDENDFAAIEAQLDPVDATSITATRIAALETAAPGTEVVLAGIRWTLQADGSLTTDVSQQWTLDQTVMGIRTAG